ncbi:MAG: XcyI family restriction endonuclease [Candidatus Hydrogenedentes bacterium]|nr:XcyI family restriction endonuclease [Candidatus Hydrogenedentota bacterium]
MMVIKSIQIPAPAMQVDFSIALLHLRKTMLQDALGACITELDLVQVDRELADTAPSDSLKALAGNGLRGELLFAVPCVLSKNPRLLGYYRMLLGHSKKLFYTSETGLAAFKRMEEGGTLSDATVSRLDELCRRLNESASTLMEGLGQKRLSKELLDDLTLLTLGPQLRGGENVKKGITAINTVFDVIHDIVREHANTTETNKIALTNAAGRKVTIQFSPDPDIVIREEMSGGGYREIIAIEVKGGTDFSNIHNRIGEAEKSHQKACERGFVECWTVVNVPQMDTKMAHQESPSTDRFYNIEAISAGVGEEYTDFKNRIIGATGIVG